MNILTSEARDIGRFIRAKRELAGIDSYPRFPRRRRHVQHLTQGELAELVGVSTIVISQIEQARYPNVTSSVLNKIADALHFTSQQRHYLLGLLQPRAEAQVTEDAAPDWVQGFIEQMQYPAIIVNPVFEVKAANRYAEAFFGAASQQPLQNDNLARLVFLEPKIKALIADQEAMAASLVSGLKMYFAVAPHYRDRIENLGADLSASDEFFRKLWEQDDPLVRATIEKVFNHPILGPVKMNQILSDIVEAPNLTKIDFVPADEDSRTKLEALLVVGHHE